MKTMNPSSSTCHYCSTLEANQLRLERSLATLHLKLQTVEKFLQAESAKAQYLEQTLHHVKQQLDDAAETESDMLELMELLEAKKGHFRERSRQRIAGIQQKYRPTPAEPDIDVSPDTPQLTFAGNSNNKAEPHVIE